MLSSRIGLISIIVSCAATLTILSFSSTVDAFQSTTRSNPVSALRLNAESNEILSEETTTSRRNVLQKSAGVAFSILLTGTSLSESASASYSAYTRREDDWKEREKKGGELADCLLLMCSKNLW